MFTYIECLANLWFFQYSIISPFQSYSISINLSCCVCQLNIFYIVCKRIYMCKIGDFIYHG